MTSVVGGDGVEVGGVTGLVTLATALGECFGGSFGECFEVGGWVAPPGGAAALRLGRFET